VSDFEAMLSGGHPNSLGRTVEVVEAVLANRSRLADLFACYRSADPVVRLRVSSAFKRVEAARHEWLIPWIDPLIDEIGALDQASAQWTLAHLLLKLTDDLSPHQRQRALAVLKRNLTGHDDWIVLNLTMETLVVWAKVDRELADWLRPHLDHLTLDRRKSVAARARKLKARLA